MTAVLPRPARKRVPVGIGLEAALLQLGLDPATAILDHAPPLALRAIHDDGSDYDPPQHSVHHLQWLGPLANDVKTFGRGGERRITTADGDIGKIAKTRRLSKQQAEARHRMLVKDAGEEQPSLKWPQGRKLRSRGFQKVAGP